MNLKLKLEPIKNIDIDNTKMQLTITHPKDNTVLVQGDFQYIISSNSAHLSVELDSKIESMGINPFDVVEAIESRSSTVFSEENIASKDEVVKRKLKEYLETLSKRGDSFANLDIKATARHIKEDIFNKSPRETEELEKFLVNNLTSIHEYKSTGDRNVVWQSLYDYSYASDSVELNESMATLSDKDVIPFVIDNCASYLFENIDKQFSPKLNKKKKAGIKR